MTALLPTDIHGNDGNGDLVNVSADLGKLGAEIQRRRTFAIISHPDAGKTTLTEKFLLYAGCIDVAGAVRGRKTRRAVTSDFMELERERGISISSTVLSFTYRDHVINLLDTPGHQDFSEDTYRTLAAADSAVMVIDAAKGIETQTTKSALFERFRSSRSSTRWIAPEKTRSISCTKSRKCWESSPCPGIGPLD